MAKPKDRVKRCERYQFMAAAKYASWINDQISQTIKRAVFLSFVPKAQSLMIEIQYDAWNTFVYNRKSYMPNE